jgi:hypothetical protein
MDRRKLLDAILNGDADTRRKAIQELKDTPPPSLLDRIQFTMPLSEMTDQELHELDAILTKAMAEYERFKGAKDEEKRLKTLIAPGIKKGLLVFE